MLRIAACTICALTICLVLVSRHGGPADRLSYGAPGACGATAPSQDTPATCLPGPEYIYTKVRTLFAGPPE
ncbi:hypothetical protein [Actibacterium mucosum]|nr:hypothetical protein [Actibacterium mucosum]